MDSVGQAFEQEKAPGIAEDRFKTVAVDLTVTKFNLYFPGVGFVREEYPGASFDLISN